MRWGGREREGAAELMGAYDGRFASPRLSFVHVRGGFFVVWRGEGAGGARLFVLRRVANVKSSTRRGRRTHATFFGARRATRRRKKEKPNNHVPISRSSRAARRQASRGVVGVVAEGRAGGWGRGGRRLPGRGVDDGGVGAIGRNCLRPRGRRDGDARSKPRRRRSPPGSRKERQNDGDPPPSQTPRDATSTIAEHASTFLEQRPPGRREAGEESVATPIMRAP